MIRSILNSVFITVFLLAPFITKGQVVANFTADDTAGCAPMVVHFTNTSTGGATTYNWNLGNGTLSSLTNVSGAYLTAGTYTITLVASNGSSSNTKTMTIRVYALPTVNFAANDTTICPGTSINFTSTSSSGAWGPMTYNWNFGDGLTSSAAAPSHTYPLSGHYNVTLFVTNVKGCINSRSRNPYIEVFNPPSVGLSASATTFCHPPGFAAFSNTTIGIGPFTNFWKFGDGGTSTLANPPHNYMSTGLFDVSLRVTDANGCKDSLFFPGYVTVTNLDAAFTSPPAACLNATVPFTNTSTAHVSSLWDFGDGFSSSVEDPTHEYSAVGTYNVKLIIYDGICYDTVIKPISIQKPTGSFNITPIAPCPPPRVLTFTATVPPGNTVSWYSLVEGPLGVGTTVNHLYPVRMTSGGPVGTIDSITMVITNSIGCKDTVGKRDTINYLNVTITGGPFEGCSPLNSLFEDRLLSTVYDPFSNYPWYAHGYPPPTAIVYNYPYAASSHSWNFGDGSPLSTLDSPWHTYTTVGAVYHPRVNLMTSNGCPGSTTGVDDSVTVGSMPPTPTYTRSASRSCAGKPVYFHASAAGTFDKYIWDFGDGHSDTGVAPMHIFTMPGIFNVELVTSYNGCRSIGTIMKDTIDSPNAIIRYDFDCIPRNKISFRDSSFGDDNHLWTFSDGFTSTIRNLTHTFPAVAIYNVTLTTHNIASGCRDTARYSLNLAPMPVSITPLKSKLCRDAPDTIAAFAGGVIGTDETYVNKYKWYYDGSPGDSFFTAYPYDTVYHSFPATGFRHATVVFTDNHGCESTLDTVITVAKPVDSFSISPPAGCAPLYVTFTDHSTDVPGIAITRYSWLFGDGSSTSGTSPVVSHIYTANGTYYIKQIVTDTLGCMDTLISSTHPVVSRPTAAFTAVSTTVCAKRSLHFNNTTAGTFTSMWFFGDGDTSTTPAPNHAYSAAGTYTVRLVVTNSSGCKDTLTRTNYILVRPLPIPSFFMDDSFAVCSPLNVHFTNTSTGATSYFWTFGDGTSSSAPTPSDVYITPGYYRVKLLAINAFSCSDTAIGHVNLFGYSGAFTYTPRSGCQPLAVHFNASVPPVASLVWDFSDGVTSTPSLIDTITHVYSTTGTFIPKLILTDSFGCTNFSVGTDTIKVDNITSNFTATPNPVCPFNIISFHDTTSSAFSPVTGWLWTFAPGYTSTAASPTFSYSVAGSYPVTLSVTDAWGCTSVVTKNVTVNAVPSPITGPSTVCIATTMTLSNTVTGGIWTSSNPTIATIGSSSGTVTGITIGVVTITYSAGLGCTAVKTITVNPLLTAITGVASMCVGGSSVLSNATAGGVWSSGSSIATVGSASGLVSGISAGTTNISYTVGGCVATKAVTINPLPASFTGSKSVCIGLTTTLNTTPSGGTWVSGSTGVATIGSASGILTGVSAGTANITHTLPTGCKLTETVTVNAYPSPIAGGSFVCIAGSSTLTDATPGGTWTSTNTAVATIGSLTGTVTGTGIGTDTIIYRVAGCAVIKTITVNTLPSGITGPGNVCVGSTVTLSDSTPGGVWSTGSAFVATVGSSSGVVLGAHLGTTTIFYSLGAGCTASTSFTVNPIPATITGSPILCIGTTSTLVDVSTGGVWSSAAPGIAAIGSLTGIATGVSGGVTTISYTLPTGCVNTMNVSVNAVSPITGLHNLCAWGDTVTVFDADPAGSYSSSLVTILNLGGGAGRITSYAPGTATITYTLFSGCVYTAAITINPLPTSIVGNTNMCVGDSSVYVNTSPGGGVWSSSNPVVGSTDSLSGMVKALSGGMARIRFTLPTGCKIDTQLNVTPIPSPGAISGPDQLCPGQTITLSDPILGGTWSATNANATVALGIVTGVTPGIDTIKYLVSNMCGSATSTRIVTVNPLPFAGTINGPSVLCVGETIALTNAATGGVWSSWNTTATVAGGNVTGVTAGVDTIYYTVTNSCGTEVTKHTVTINPLPVASNLTGASRVCAGDTIVISNTVSGGVLSLTNTNAVLVGWVVTGIIAGQDTLLYTVTNSCGSATTTKPITIDPLPDAGAINGTASLCIGDNITLGETVSGGVWGGSDHHISTSGSLTVTGLTEGIDTITYAVTNTCGTSVAAMTVTVNPLPAGLVITRTDKLLFVDQGYAAYQWTHNGVPIPGATTYAFNFVDTGSYSVMVTNQFGCSFTFGPYEITDCFITDLLVYPNPAEYVVYIQWCKSVTARLSCMDGKIVAEIKDATQVNIGDLPNGIYTLTIYDGSNKKILTKRITKLAH